MSDRVRRGRLVWSLAAAALALGVAGCFYPHGRMDEARVQANSVFAACERAREAGRYPTHRAAVECAVPKVQEAYREAAYPYVDLLYIRIEARRRGAGKVDQGEVTEAQYQQDIATLEARIEAEEARRAELTGRGLTPTPAPDQTLVAGLPSFAAAPTAELPTPGSCLPLGAIRACK
jgi:hypothetical protein